MLEYMNYYSHIFKKMLLLVRTDFWIVYMQI